MTPGPTLGVTLFSFTDAYHARRYTFEELIRKSGSLGLGPGLEIVGFQSIRCYPTITDSFELRFKRLLDESGLEPSALGERAHRGESSAFAERRGVMRAAAEMNAGPSTMLAWISMTLFGHQSPEAWAEIMHQVVHVHAKFYEIDAAGNEPSVPYEESMRVFRDGGYAGYISSGWEGDVWNEDADPFELVRRHQDLMRRHLASHEAKPVEAA